MAPFALIPPSTALWLGFVFFFAFFAILFLQSGMDKVLDWQGNLGWLKGHFAKSPLAGMVPLLLGALTAMEVLGGVGSVACIVFILIDGLHESNELILEVTLWNILTLLALFFGQRMAKDYAGAAGIVPYFIVALGGLFLFLAIG